MLVFAIRVVSSLCSSQTLSKLALQLYIMSLLLDDRLWCRTYHHFLRWSGRLFLWLLLATATRIIMIVIKLAWSCRWINYSPKVFIRLWATVIWRLFSRYSDYRCHIWISSGIISPICIFWTSNDVWTNLAWALMMLWLLLSRLLRSWNHLCIILILFLLLRCRHL